MATFAELVTAAATAALIEKIKIATLIAADVVRAEGTGVANHQARVQWASRVFTNPDTEATRMIWPVLIQNRAFTLAQIQGASDTLVQSAVDAAVGVIVAGA
jgi:hypothetical protein